MSGAGGAAATTGTGGAAGAGGTAGMPGGGPGGFDGAATCADPPVMVGDLNFGWAFALGGGALGGLAIDGEGNAVVSGAYLDGLLLGGQTLTSGSASGIGYHAFVAVLDPAGNLRWAKTLPGNWEPAGVGLDGSGNIYLAGSSYAGGAIDLGNGPLSGTLLVAKLDPTGSTIWSRSFAPGDGSGAGLLSGSLALATDAAGDLAVTGAVAAPVDFGGGAPPPPADQYLGFLAVFDTNGTYRFDKSFASNGLPSSVAFDQSGDLLFGGPLNGALDLGGVTLKAGSMGSGFAALLDPTGAPRWGYAFGDGSSTRSLAIGDGVSFVSGNFDRQLAAAGLTATATGLDDLFLFADDQTRAATNLTASAADGDFIGALAPAGDGGAVALAQVTTVVNLGTGLIGQPGLALLRTDRLGRTLASATFDAPVGASPGSVAVDGDGGIFVYGTFQGAIDLGGGTLSGAGNAGNTLFLARFTQAPAGPARHAAACPLPVADALLGGSAPVGEPTAMLLVGDTLYYTTGTEVAWLPASGGPPALLATGQRNVVALATDGQNLYWSAAGHDSYQGLASDGQIISLPLAGGTPTILASGQDAPSAIAVDDVNVYWVTGGRSTTSSNSSAGGNVFALPKTGGGGGGAVTALANLDMAGPLAAANGWVIYGSAKVTSTMQISATITSQISAVPRTGGTPTVLTTSDHQISSLVTDGTTVFWTDASSVGIDFSIDDGRVKAVPLAGGSVTMLADGQPGPFQLTLVGDQLYWANRGGSVNVTPRNNAGISRTSKKGGPIQAIVQGLTGVEALAADGTHVAYVRSVEPYYGSWALLAAPP